METKMIGELRPSYSSQQMIGALTISHACPVLYRFMREEHVDDFLREGRIMISTIPRCRELENKRRRDETESIYGYDLKWSGRTTTVNAKVGENAFVLCCSLTQQAIHEKSQMFCLELHHWNELMIEIGEKLRHQGFPVGDIFAGPCNYAEKRRCIDMRPQKYGDVGMEDVLTKLGPEAFYTTKNFYFAREYEYRVLWLSNDRVPDKGVFVTVQHPERYGCKVPAIGETYESD